MRFFKIKIFYNSTPSPEKEVSKKVFGNSRLRSNMEMARSIFTTGGLKFKIKKNDEKQFKQSN